MAGHVFLIQKSSINLILQSIGQSKRRCSAQVFLTEENIFPFDTKRISMEVCTALRSEVAASKRRSYCTLDIIFEDLTNEFGYDTETAVQIRLKGDALTTILKHLDINSILLKVILKNIQYKQDGKSAYSTDRWIPEIRTIDMVPIKGLGGSAEDFHFQHAFSKLPSADLQQYMFSSNTTTKMDMSILLSAKFKQTNPVAVLIQALKEKHEPSPLELVSFMQNLFENKFLSDSVIVAANGAEHECHKLVLASNSAVFAAMPDNDNFEEGKTKRIKIDDMSEVGVKSLLQYLYYLEVGAAQEDFDIAMELLEAAEKYAIDRLKSSMTKIIIARKSIWDNAESALRLFCFTSTIDGCDDAAVDVMIRYKENLKTSEQYQELFKKAPSVAIDLCNELLR